MRQWLVSDGMVIVKLDLSKALRFRHAVWAALEEERRPSDKAVDAFTDKASVLCEFYQGQIARQGGLPRGSKGVVFEFDCRHV
jgi:hypothetical protein